jgi:hypothetical protein
LQVVVVVVVSSFFKSSSSFESTSDDRLMSRPPYPAYPHHHPHHGRPYIVVHDHDVLCGRGVNIAQHAGNERFRALVNTRQDESYCTTFTTSEKRALAEEIVSHIRVLEPPGRFLKRTGRSQSSRGLNGPWEELTYRECIKKTCQALRDCNRMDRIGYAAQVAVPEDVKESADERSKTGLSLKEHAAAAVAKANPSTLHSHHLNMNPPALDQNYASAATFPQRKRSLDSAARFSPSVEHAAEWLKKQRTDDPFSTSSFPEPSDPVLSSLSSGMHSTPASFVAPVPVSTTPPNSQQNADFPHPYTDHIPLSQHTTSPQLPASPSSFHHEAQVAIVAPYSPVAILSPQGPEAGDEGIPSPQDLDGTHFHHQRAYLNHHHHHEQTHQFHEQHFQHHANQSDDVLQSAAEAAAALINHPDHGSSLSLLSGDDLPHGSLGISDL